jgi:hypothetical protein
LFVLAAYPTSAEEAASAGSRRPFGDKPHAIPGKIEAEHYDEGKPGEVYHDLDEKNQGADYRGLTQVDIEKREDASGGHGIGWTKAGEWLTYSVIVKESGTYDVEFAVDSNKKGGSFHLEFDGEDVTGPIDVPDTGGWQKLKMITKKNVHLQAGTYVMKMVMDTEGKSGFVADIDSIEFMKASS